MNPNKSQTNKKPQSSISRFLRLPDGNYHKASKKVRPYDELFMEIISAELGFYKDRRFFFITKIDGESNLLPVCYPSNSEKLSEDNAKLYFLFHLCGTCVSRCCQLENPSDLERVKLLNDVASTNRNGLLVSQSNIVATKAILDSSEAVSRLLNALLRLHELTTESVPVKNQSGALHELSVARGGLTLKAKFNPSGTEEISWNQIGQPVLRKSTVRVPISTDLEEKATFRSFISEKKPKRSFSFTRKTRSHSATECSSSVQPNPLELRFVLTDATSAKELFYRLAAARLQAIETNAVTNDSKHQDSENAVQTGFVARLGHSFRQSFRRISRSMSRKRKASEKVEKTGMAVSSMPLSAPPVCANPSTPTEVSVTPTGDEGISPSTKPSTPFKNNSSPTSMEPSTVSAEEAELNDRAFRSLVHQQNAPIRSTETVSLRQSPPVNRPAYSASNGSYALGVKSTIMQPVCLHANSRTSSVSPSSPLVALPAIPKPGRDLNDTSIHPKSLQPSNELVNQTSVTSELKVGLVVSPTNVSTPSTPKHVVNGSSANPIETPGLPKSPVTKDEILGLMAITDEVSNRSSVECTSPNSPIHNLAEHINKHSRASLAPESSRQSPVSPIPGATPGVYEPLNFVEDLESNILQSPPTDVERTLGPSPDTSDYAALDEKSQVETFSVVKTRVSGDNSNDRESTRPSATFQSKIKPPSVAVNRNTLETFRRHPEFPQPYVSMKAKQENAGKKVIEETEARETKYSVGDQMQNTPVMTSFSYSSIRAPTPFGTSPTSPPVRPTAVSGIPAPRTTTPTAIRLSTDGNDAKQNGARNPSQLVQPQTMVSGIRPPSVTVPVSLAPATLPSSRSTIPIPVSTNNSGDYDTTSSSSFSSSTPTSKMPSGIRPPSRVVPPNHSR